MSQAPDRGAAPIILWWGGALENFVNQAPDRGAVPIILEGASSNATDVFWVLCHREKTSFVKMVMKRV